MRVNKGRAGYVYRGEYNSETAYEKLDTVYDSNTTYQCTAPCTGKKPSENSDYWTPMCASATAVDRQAAEDAAVAAERSKNSADASAAAAGASANAAESAASLAAASAAEASGSASAATGSASAAETAKTDAETARDQAQQAAASIPTMQSIMLALRPVGSLYESLEATDPGTLFGGTWEALPPGVFLISAGTGYEAGTTGGETNHVLTKEELPSIPANPGIPTKGNVAQNTGGPIVEYMWYGAQSSAGYNFNNPIQNLGSGLGHNNLPPYLAVYRWRRTA